MKAKNLFRASARYWSEQLRHWLRWRMDCAWCHRRLRGNPFARRRTHGVCPCCANEWRAASALRTR